MNQHARNIGRTLSLRTPQQQALNLLARLCDEAGILGDAELVEKLAAVQRVAPSVEDFEREFPSLCFDLATGVGKTRLMGASVAFLHRAYKVRHFLILAPGGTIYDKLVADFTAGTPKYVFPGIAEFATNPPLIVTGENWDDGRVIAEQLRAQQQALSFAGDRVILYIFNIQKIATRYKEGRKTRTFRETLGMSLFEHLTAQQDLVVLMDEAHRYRADVARETLADLQPRLGIEVTATPQVQKGKSAVSFLNVAYSYNLARALEDGFVKVPVVATRADLQAKQLGEEQLERLKLEDAMRFHETRKVELETYHRETGARLVKPFVMVICADIDHAKKVEATMQGEDFFGGRYSGAVIRVDSETTKSDDEVPAKMLALEKPENTVEVVIHVNMLREGWDVTNLYTVVPLRKADSRTLVEQAIGRGLRLPFGRRVSNSNKDYDPEENPWYMLDRLMIVGHEHFERIVNEANDEASVLRRAERIVYRDEDLKERVEVVVQVSTVATGAEEKVQPAIEKAIEANRQEQIAKEREAKGDDAGPPPPKATAEYVRQVATRVTADTNAAVARAARKQGVRSATDLAKPEVRKKVIEAAIAELGPAQQSLPTLDLRATAETVFETILDNWKTRAIDVPDIHVIAEGRITGHDDFDYQPPAAVLEPIADQIKLKDLDRTGRETLLQAAMDPGETSLENQVVAWLMYEPGIDYQQDSALLWKLAGQLVAAIRSQRQAATPAADAVTIEGDINNVLLFHRDVLRADLLLQLAAHRYEKAANMRREARESFLALQDTTAPRGQVVPLATTPKRPGDVKTTFYGPFERACQSTARFDSDTERLFALILEKDPAVQRWMRPPNGKFPAIYYDQEQRHRYEPDFVVEAADKKYLVETKARRDLSDVQVKAKNVAAKQWCEWATEWEQSREGGGKPWVFAILAHDQVTMSATFGGLMARAAAQGAA